MQHLRMFPLGVAILFSAQMARAQAGSRASAWNQHGEGRPARTAPPSQTAATGNTSFASRLGSTVGSQAPPAVGLPPGVGNINNPGVAPSIQPSPGIQPLPTTLFGIPNINFPGGVPAPSHPPADHHGNDHRNFGPNRHGSPTILFYGVPYYVPYLVYPADSGAAPAPSSPTTSLSGSSSGYDSFTAPVPGSTQDSAQGAPDSGKLITLLALKDHTILAVTDYWLDGESLDYQTESGEQASIPLSQLDFTLTQQLNRERNVRFVLESLP
jgi:hypothetical protein